VRFARFVGSIKKAPDRHFVAPPLYFRRSRRAVLCRFDLLVPPIGVMNVVTAKHLAAKEITSMSNITIDTEKTPTAAPQPSKSETKTKEARQRQGSKNPKLAAKRSVNITDR
jgi:hypothetical protein